MNESKIGSEIYPFILEFSIQKENFVFFRICDLFFIGSRNVFSYTEPNEDVDFDEIDGRYIFKLNPFIDMNLMAEYRYNKRVSAFIQFNNFTAKKYQFWTNYPVQSINILGGVTFSF